MMEVIKGLPAPARSRKGGDRAASLLALAVGDALYDADAKNAATFNGTAFKIHVQHGYDFVKRDGQWKLGPDGKSLVQVSTVGATIWRVK